MNEGFYIFLIKTAAPPVPVIFTHFIISLQNAQLQQEDLYLPTGLYIWMNGRVSFLPSCCSCEGAAFPELLEYVESVSVGVTKRGFFKHS